MLENYDFSFKKFLDVCPFTDTFNSKHGIVQKQGTNLTFTSYGEVQDRMIFLVGAAASSLVFIQGALLCSAIAFEAINGIGRFAKLVKSDQFNLDNFIIEIIDTSFRIGGTIVCGLALRVIVFYGIVFPNDARHTYARLEQMVYGKFYISKVFNPILIQQQ